ncbi:MAG TPA: MFS transporter, partial [Steroidobacteraceae bacterium]
ALGAVVLSIGFVLIGTAQNRAWYFSGWAVLGVGMGAGLYDAAFATLGNLYGKSARGAITGVTLLGGFASTVCWPLSAYLVEHVGWRATCLVYGALYAAVALPLYLLALPRRGPEAATIGAPVAKAAS